MHEEHSWTRIRGRNSNTQLFIGFDNNLIIILFTKIREIKNNDFLNKNIFL